MSWRPDFCGEREKGKVDHHSDIPSPPHRGKMGRKRKKLEGDKMISLFFFQQQLPGKYDAEKIKELWEMLRIHAAASHLFPSARKKKRNIQH